jgi:hypothetical protein
MHYATGQVWSYTTRPGEEGSTLLVLGVEVVDGLGTVVHVAVESVHVKDPRSVGGERSMIAHVVFEPKGLDKSVTELVEVRDDLVPALRNVEGYEEWRRDLEAHAEFQVVAYLCSVSMALDLIGRD